MEQKKSVVIYTEYDELSPNEKYKLGFYGKLTQFFEKGCNGTRGVEISKHNGNVPVCDGCFNIRLKYGQNIRQIFRDRAIKFGHAL